MTIPILKKFVVFRLQKGYWTLNRYEEQHRFLLEFEKSLPFDTREECEAEVLKMMKDYREKKINVKLILQEVYFFADDEILGGI